MRRQWLVLLSISQPGQGLRITLFAHVPIGGPGQLPPGRLMAGLGHTCQPEVDAIGQYCGEQRVPNLRWCLRAQMQKTITQTGPLIDLGKQFGNLDMWDQRIGLFGKGFGGFRVFLRKGEMRKSPSASETSGKVFSRALRATVAKFSSSLSRHSAMYDGKFVSMCSGNGA